MTVAPVAFVGFLLLFYGVFGTDATENMARPLLEMGASHSDIQTSCSHSREINLHNKGKLDCRLDMY
jgi:hypothetical protein